ncbi:hypothetical protein [Streptomyces rubradiris]|uniref:Uncharacterized protein n=1 Tax=Streptomyces rubradiris TaxID=285531 RepID=A0ABQ3RCW1_STRRR|nr:hypothetical protein [Streptomyces rubradiris]GHG94461.1 hypothetical protein GCM10018792_04360 [Streptomyces rubradiris]GHI53697.1 hypothetical protein Srubr_35430 [Streptomyces rubradiris]
MTEALPYGSDGGHRLVIGDLNLLEPGHIPRYEFFEKFEYDFYRWLMRVGYVDAVRALRPRAREYSWFGRRGDGFRYDHAHVSRALAPTLRSCVYAHGVRTDHKPQLTDHSALTVSLAVQPSAPLSVTSPELVSDLATPARSDDR